jgi:prophage regulatory protein
MSLRAESATHPDPEIAADPCPPLRLIRMPEVERYTALKKSALYALIKEKKFPSPVKVAGQTAWVEGEVQAWIQARIRERDQGVAMGVRLGVRPE